MKLPAVFKTVRSTHTCIALSSDKGRVAYVMLENLELSSSGEATFLDNFVEMPEYPVSRNSTRGAQAPGANSGRPGYCIHPPFNP
jgi:hypothetical protein